jgi:hypothetical protein
MLPTCLLLLVLIFLALSAHMVLDAIPAWDKHHRLDGGLLMSSNEIA